MTQYVQKRKIQKDTQTVLGSSLEKIGMKEKKLSNFVYFAFLYTSVFLKLLHERIFIL